VGVCRSAPVRRSDAAGSQSPGATANGLPTQATCNQHRPQTLVQQAVRREALYAEFVAEAAGRLAGPWSHEAGGPEVIASLWGAVVRRRLTLSEPWSLLRRKSSGIAALTVVLSGEASAV
jgi:hypothetical protein